MAAPIDARFEKLPRRAGPRVAFQSRVLLELEGHAPVEGVTLDVGLGGMCAQVGGVVALDRIRRVEVQVGRRSLSAPARGAWRREAHGDGSVILGMQFTDLEDVQISLLWETLNRRALELTRFLVEHSSLHPIEVDVAMDLALRTRRRELGPDRYLYRQGSRGPEESIFIIASGSVALEVTRDDGESVVLDRAVAGNVFGGLPMLAGLDHVDSARTLDATQLLEVDRYSFADLLAEKPLVGRALERAVMTKYLARFRALQRSA